MSDTGGSGSASQEAPTARVHWDQAQMKTDFANVINVVSTREEFSVLFGMNSTMPLSEAKGFEVKQTRLPGSGFADGQALLELNIQDIAPMPEEEFMPPGMDMDEPPED